MQEQLDVLARALASGEVSRREAVRRVGGLLGGAVLAYFGIGCAPDEATGPATEGPRLNGAPGDCKRNGKACKKHSQCCSGHCVGNVCTPCASGGLCPTTCCAAGQLCLNGACANACTSTGGNCAIDTCSEGTCPESVTQSGFCGSTTEGQCFCAAVDLCGDVQTCTTSKDCPQGSVCTVTSCPGGSRCLVPCGSSTSGAAGAAAPSAVGTRQALTGYTIAGRRL